MCDSRVLLAGRGELWAPLHVFDVSEAHTVRHSATVRPPNWFYGLACTRRGDDTIVAFSHETAVSLQWLASQRLEQLASAELSDPDKLLFRGDVLLVADWNISTGTPAIKSLSEHEGSLAAKELLGYRSGVRTRVWALAGDRLVSSNDQNSHDLLTYTVVLENF